MNGKISVVLVDDSSVIRGALSRIIKTDNNIEIIGSVANGLMAITIAKTKLPDVMILDVEMPVMDGITAIPQILKESPNTKIIMCSSLTAKGADTTIKAMTRGAVECIVKPSSAQDTGAGSEFHGHLLNLINTLGKPKPVKAPTTQAIQATPQRTTKPTLTPTSTTRAPARTSAKYTLNNNPLTFKGKPSILAIGSSTGGPNALFEVLKGIGKINVPIVITQHMPATFTEILAKHISQHTGIPTYEAQEGMAVTAGNIYVAQGGKHMLFEQSGGQLKIKLDDGPQENFCKPSVDPMLRSLTGIYGNKVLCVILTGMGHDGLEEARALSKINGRIIAQDEKTSVVWGMPGAVAMAGICSEVLPLKDISTSVKNIIR